jgi:hypothetical protein
MAIVLALALMRGELGCLAAPSISSTSPPQRHLDWPGRQRDDSTQHAIDVIPPDPDMDVETTSTAEISTVLHHPNTAHHVPRLVSQLHGPPHLSSRPPSHSSEHTGQPGFLSKLPAKATRYGLLPPRQDWIPATRMPCHNRSPGLDSSYCRDL